jgi:hypothetical protein
MPIEKPTIIYVGGYGRSGSTLLDRILGQHPQIFSGGELLRYSEFSQASRPCGCGEPVVNCPVWCKVRHLTNAIRIPGAPGWLDSCLGLVLGNSASRSRKNTYSEAQNLLFDSISEISHAKMIVDSSKTAYWAAGRPLALHRDARMQVFFIHLVRHPYSVWASLSRGTNKQLEGRNSHARSRRMMGFRAAVGWWLANAAAVETSERLGPEFAMTIRYEDLIDRTADEISRVESLLNLNLGICLDVLAGRTPPREQHIAEGNRSRGRALKLRASQECPIPNPTTKRTIDVICGRLMRRFGYDSSGACRD